MGESIRMTRQLRRFHNTQYPIISESVLRYGYTIDRPNPSHQLRNLTTTQFRTFKSES